MAKASSSIQSGLVWGVILGLFAGAFTLGVLAIQNANRACEFPDTEECLFELQAWAEISRLESYASLGLALIGVGLFLLNRRRTGSEQ